MQISADAQELLTVDEVAERLRVSRGSVYRHVRTGRIPAVRLSELGPWRIPAEAVETLLRPARRTAE